MDPDELFPEMLNELRRRSSKRPPSKYDFAVIGLLLRILLIDGRLVREINFKKRNVLYRIPKLKGEQPYWSSQGVLGIFDFLCSTGRSSQFMAWLESEEKIIEEKAPAAAKSVTAKSIAANQLETVWRSAGGHTGRFATGFQPDHAEDHYVSLCGYGSLAWLAQQLGVQVPVAIRYFPRS
jgi:hypothetical protein